MTINFKNINLVNLLVFIGFILIIFTFRYDLIRYSIALNPDEAQFVAAAMRMVEFGWSFDAVDNGSSGPINTLILTWPYFLGLDINMATARITDALLVTITTFFIYKILFEVSKTVFLPLVLSSIMLMFYANTSFFDFAHYSSEKLSTAILVASLYYILKITLAKSYSKELLLNVAIIAFLLGCIPLAKLQAAPLAFFIGVYLLIVISLNKNLNRYRLKIVIITVVLALLPLILFILPVYLRGNILDFYHGYISWALNYVSQPLTLDAFMGMVLTDGNYSRVFRYTMIGSVILFAITMIIQIYKRQYKVDDNYRLTFFIALVISLGLSYYIIIKPGRAFTHYLNFILPFSALLFAYLCLHFIKLMEVLNFNKTKNIIFFLSILVILNFSFKSMYNKTNYLIASTDKGMIYKRDLLKWLNPQEDDTLLVWGWMCELYIDTGIAPATKELTSYNQIYKPNPYEFYKERYLKDFKNSSPKFVIDAVAPGSFAFTNIQTQSIKNYKELFEIINNNYTLVTKKENFEKCPRLYIKNSELGYLNNDIIPSKVIASDTLSDEFDVMNLFDNSVFESCKDYWLLPDGKLGNIVFKFDKAVNIDKMLLLNTKNGMYKERGSDKIKITVYDSLNRSYDLGELYMQRYPQWTEMDMSKIKDIVTVKVEILSFYQNGAGLNEIKFLQNK